MRESLLGNDEQDVKDNENEEAEIGLTLERYASTYRLHAADLATFGLRTVPGKCPIIAMPYRDRDGRESAVRLCKSVRRETMAVWNSGDGCAPALYGLENIPKRGNPLFLVVGEPNCHTLWHYGIDAIAMATPRSFNVARDDGEIEDYDLTVLLDPDEDGDAQVEALAFSRLRYEMRVTRLSRHATISAAHVQHDDVKALLAEALAAAEPLDAYLRARPHLDKLKHPERIEIEIKAGQRPRVADETIAVIQQRGALYERGGELVRLCGESVIPVDEFWLSDYLSRQIAFFRYKPSKEEDEFVRVEIDPPAWLSKVINAKRGERGLHELTGIITAPTLRADGSLLNKPGFDTATGLLLRPGQWPRVPLDPDRGALAAAWQTLWKPVSEFPYVSNDDRGVTVAAQLTAIVRRILPKAPAFSFDAPAAGSGKTLLATCIAELAGGEIAAVPECREEEELRKRLLSALRDGQPTLLLDNIKGQFASSALEAFLTDDYYSDRVLSASQMLRLRTNVLMLISGNNFIPRGDLWRRIVTARIDPKVEHAERRSFTLDARKHSRENRQQIIAAGLTLLRGFIAAGQPRHTKDRLASFEMWDDLIRQCILWMNETGIAELGDPTLSIAKAKEVEPERMKLGSFLEVVRAIMGAGTYATKWRTSDLIQEANASLGLGSDNQRDLRDVLIEIAGERNNINARMLGRWIERQTDARCGGLYVQRVGEKQRAALWRIGTDEEPAVT